MSEWKGYGRVVRLQIETQAHFGRSSYSYVRVHFCSILEFMFSMWRASYLPPIFLCYLPCFLFVFDAGCCLSVSMLACFSHSMFSMLVSIVCVMLKYYQFCKCFWVGVLFSVLFMFYYLLLRCFCCSFDVFFWVSMLLILYSCFFPMLGSWYSMFIYSGLIREFDLTMVGFCGKAMASW